MMDDIYGDLEDFAVGDSIKEVQEENKKLTLHINELTSTLSQTMKELENIKKANNILQQNISKLFNTAKADYDRRTRRINELQRQLDDLVFKRNQGQNFRIPKRKPEQQEVCEPETKKRKLTEGDIKTTENKQFNNDRKNSGALKDLYKNDSVKRDRSVKTRDNRHNYRRSRSRSRERRRKTPPRDSYRSNRNKSRHYSPDLKPKNKDVDPVNFEEEQKRLLEMINQKKIERSDSESIVSIHSTSSLDDIIAQKPEVIKKKDKIESKSKEKRHSKNKKSDKHCDKGKNIETKINKPSNKNDIKVKQKIKTEEVEEGEISDDDSEISKEKIVQCKEEIQDKSSINVTEKKEDKNAGKLTTNKAKIEKLPVVKNEPNTTNDCQNASINDEASISFLLQQSEEIKKVINEIDENSIKSTPTTVSKEIKSEIICSENKMPVPDNKIKCEIIKPLEKPVLNSIDKVKDISESIVTVKDTRESVETCKENVSNNKGLETNPKKSKRRRCVLMIN